MRRLPKRKLVVFLALRFGVILFACLVILAARNILPEKLTSIQTKRQQTEEATAQIRLLASLKQDAAELVPYTEQVRDLVPVLDFTSFNSAKQKVTQTTNQMLQDAVITFSDPAAGTPGFENVVFKITAQTESERITSLFREFDLLPVVIVISGVSSSGQRNELPQFTISGFMIFRASRP